MVYVNSTYFRSMTNIDYQYSPYSKFFLNVLPTSAIFLIPPIFVQFTCFCLIYVFCFPLFLHVLDASELSCMSKIPCLLHSCNWQKLSTPALDSLLMDSLLVLRSPVS